MTEMDPHEAMLTILHRAGVTGMGGPQMHAALTAAGVEVSLSTVYRWLTDRAVDAGYGRYTHPQIDPAALPEARLRMRGLLESAGGVGVSGQALMASLGSEGHSVPSSTLYGWLAADAVKLGHGRFAPPESCQDRQLPAAAPPPPTANPPVRGPRPQRPSRQLPRQMPEPSTPGPPGADSPGWRLTILLAGLAVGLAGAALTASGLYAVALGCGVPSQMAWLYVLATDGLALVAYGATSVLARGRLYAWAVVLVAAGLSGLAQAVHLGQGGGTVAVVTETWLRFGVGYWPAVSTAVCAHLLWLVGRGGRVTGRVHQPVVPARPEGAEAAVYRLYDRDGDLLYVGCTIRPTVRLRSHQRRQPWWHEVAGSEVMWFPSVDQAARAEAEAVRSERPVYNVGLAAYSGAGPAEPADGEPEPAPEPSASEPIAGEPPTGAPVDPALADEPPPTRLALVSPAAGEPLAVSPAVSPGGTARLCGCGCGEMVSRATDKRHRAKQREAAELSSRAAQNGHREPVSAR